MSHIYASASSLDSGVTSNQDHTIALTPHTAALAARNEPDTRAIPREVGATTTVIARTSAYSLPKPRAMTLADVERELATSRTDPPTYCNLVADLGYPKPLPMPEESDSEQTIAWPTGVPTQEALHD